MNNGTWAGRQVVSRDFVRASAAPSTRLNDAYGYLWWLGRRGHYVLPSDCAKPSCRSLTQPQSQGKKKRKQTAVHRPSLSRFIRMHGRFAVSLCFT